MFFSVSVFFISIWVKPPATRSGYGYGCIPIGHIWKLIDVPNWMVVNHPRDTLFNCELWVAMCSACCSFPSLVNKYGCLRFYCTGLDIGKLQEVVKTRWLKPQEVLKILQNHELLAISHKPPQKPQSNKCILWFWTVNIWSKLWLI